METMCSTACCTICGFDMLAPYISVTQIHDQSDVQIANIKPLRHQTIVNSGTLNLRDIEFFPETYVL